MGEETTNRPVIRFCVDLYRAADFLLLTTMLPIVQRRLGDHCDEKMKWLCTHGNVELDATDQTALQWTTDLVDGIREAYRWNIEPIKKTMQEFVWAGRRRLLGDSWIGILEDLDSTPDFIKDMLRRCTLFPWQTHAIWAPNGSSIANDVSRLGFCCLCCDHLLRKSAIDKTQAYGQLRDPFTVSADNQTTREWCKECTAMDMIPWRQTES